MPGKRLFSLACVTSMALNCGSTSGGLDPEPVPGPGNFVRTIEWDGRVRSYRLHVPPAFRDGASMPLFLVFHGIPSSSAEIETITDFNQFADGRDFIVAYPSAVEDWNTGCSDCPGSIAADLRVDDVGFVRQLIRRIDADVGIDARRVYAAGFSNGALFVHRLSCEAADVITAFASIGATLIEASAVPPCEPARRAPLIVFHGTQDPSFPPQGRRFEERPFGGEIVEVNLLSIDGSLDTWATRNGCDLEPRVAQIPDLVNDDTTVQRYDFDGCSAGAALLFFSIEGGGHTWPGAPVTFAPFLGRKTSDIVASELISDFFLTRSR